MLTAKESELSKIYKAIAEQLNISKAMTDKAVTSYEYVGQWLQDGDLPSDVDIMPQGSFNLGTVIKPISDADDYDIDLVCLLKRGQELEARTIKNCVGDRLKEHTTLSEKLDPEGKRCWTLQYDEFHMDILPCVPKYSIFLKPYFSDIRLTHKEHDLYSDRFSNPARYQAWFEERMKVVLYEARKAFAGMQMSIESVPAFRVRTPLQMSVQLLKRHRDIMFNENEEFSDDDAPISIIITTLAAHAYANEVDVYEALRNIIGNMKSYIEQRENQWWIPNPVIPEENFADGWNRRPTKKKAFDAWLVAAYRDLIEKPIALVGIDEIGKRLKYSFGERAVNNAIGSLGEETFKASQASGLYHYGLLGGISAVASPSATKGLGHTFYGEEEEP